MGDVSHHLVNHCWTCRADFPSEEDLYRHARVVHPGGYS